MKFAAVLMLVIAASASAQERVMIPVQVCEGQRCRIVWVERVVSAAPMPLASNAAPKTDRCECANCTCSNCRCGYQEMPLANGPVVASPAEFAPATVLVRPVETRRSWQPIRRLFRFRLFR